MSTETDTISLPEGALPPEKGQEYLDQMIAKADGVKPAAPAVTPPNTEEQPKLFAGKYKSVEELEKGYAELQKMRSQPEAAKPATAPAPNEAQANATKAVADAEQAATEAAAKANGKDATDADRAAAWAADQAVKTAKAAKEAADKAPNPDADAAKKAVENVGLNFETMSAEFSEKGELSTETFAALEKAGIPRNYVDQFIAGQQAIADRMVNEVFEVAGGKETYTSMLGWASTALSPEDQQAFNVAVNGPDRAAAKLAVSGLKARYAADGGVDPSLIGGDRSSGSAGFKSENEMKQAMRDPKYRTDPDYRQDVMNRINVSKF